MAAAEQSGVPSDVHGRVQQAPLLASAPRTVRDNPDYGLVRRDANPMDQNMWLASQGHDRLAAGFSISDESWLWWPSLTDF